MHDRTLKHGFSCISFIQMHRVFIAGCICKSNYICLRKFKLICVGLSGCYHLLVIFVIQTYAFAFLKSTVYTKSF